MDKKPFSANNSATNVQTNVSVQAAPGAGKRLCITAIFLSSAAAGQISLLNGSGGAAVIGPVNVAAAGPPVGITFPDGVWLSENTALCLTSTTAGNHHATVSGHISP